MIIYCYISKTYYTYEAVFRVYFDNHGNKETFMR
jgi:hypothetical protein